MQSYVKKSLVCREKRGREKRAKIGGGSAVINHQQILLGGPSLATNTTSARFEDLSHIGPLNKDSPHETQTLLALVLSYVDTSGMNCIYCLSIEIT
jgi:hypothetical protein